jgi:hypothetical protein
LIKACEDGPGSWRFVAHILYVDIHRYTEDGSANFSEQTHGKNRSQDTMQSSDHAVHATDIFSSASYACNIFLYQLPRPCICRRTVTHKGRRKISVRGNYIPPAHLQKRGKIKGYRLIRTERHEKGFPFTATLFRLFSINPKHIIKGARCPTRGFIGGRIPKLAGGGINKVNRAGGR